VGGEKGNDLFCDGNLKEVAVSFDLAEAVQLRATINSRAAII